MERHIRWRMFLVMFIVSASPSFCPSTTMLQCLHLNFLFHVPSDFWTVMVTPMLCFVFLTAASTQHNCIFFRVYNIGLNVIHPCERVGRKYFQEILRRMMRMEWSYICFLVTTGQSPVFLLPSSGRRQAGGWRLSRTVSDLLSSSQYIRWDWRLRRALAPGRITEINYWLEVFTCLIAPNCWAILPLKLPDWVVTLSWVYSVRTGIFSIRKLVFDWCFINFMGFTIINPVFTTFLRQFGFYIFLSALKYDDQMKSTKKYEL